MRKRQPHPFENLNMGLIQQYTLIIPKTEVEDWKVRGWIESPHYRNFHYAPKEDETVVIGKPATLLETGVESLVGKKIVSYNLWYGSYGMGGPGFLGLVMEGKAEVLIFAVWGADEYTLMDGRVVACNPRYYQDWHPWTSMFANDDIPQWDDFSPIVLESIIDRVELQDHRCALVISKEGKSHQLEFLRNDDRLSRMGNGEVRNNAYDSGVIGEHVVFQHKGAILWV